MTSFSVAIVAGKSSTVIGAVSAIVTLFTCDALAYNVSNRGHCDAFTLVMTVFSTFNSVRNGREPRSSWVSGAYEPTLRLT